MRPDKHPDKRLDTLTPTPLGRMVSASEKTMKFDPQKHHRRSIRLKGYDYTQPGAYFVTMVTYHREETFGVVMNGVVNLSALGEIAREEWMRSIGIRKEICLYDDEFVVMPNHVHGIVWIVGVGADGVRPDGGVGANDRGQGAHQGAYQGAYHAPRPKPQHLPQPPMPLRRVPRSLGAFIAGYKAAVTSRAGRELNRTGVWQRNYYEHIIRNETAFKNIWNYIDDNPRQWGEDQLHPSAPPNKFNKDDDGGAKVRV